MLSEYDKLIEQKFEKKKKDFWEYALSQISSLQGASKLSQEKQERIKNLIKIVINDHYDSWICPIDTTINDKKGIYIYILTDKHLVILDTNLKDKEIKSHYFWISEITNVVFSSPDIDRLTVEVRLKNGKLIGLSYPMEMDRVTRFFKRINYYLELRYEQGQL